jgi:hypothetical protein
MAKRLTNYAQGQLYLLRLLWPTTHGSNTVSLSSLLCKMWTDNHADELNDLVCDCAMVTQDIDLPLQTSELKKM